MKQCPACNRTYTDDALLFCLEDGTRLRVAGAAQSTSANAETLISYGPETDPNQTIAFNTPRETAAPPPATPYPTAPPAGQPASAPSWTPTPQQYSPAPSTQTARKSGGKGWIIAAVAGVLAIGIGIFIFLSVGKERSNSTASTSTNSAPPVSNSLKDDFSVENWPTGESALGSFYEGGEYHMRGKPGIYIYMFPRDSAKYASADATVRVTARSVTGGSPDHGFGLIVHGKNNSKGKLEGYGFLIYTGMPPKYEIVRFSDGNPQTEVSWTPSSAIRGGTSPNQIEVRARGSQLSLYINGQFVKSITDTAGLAEGSAGLYTSETDEVAFDDMEVDR